MCTCTLVNFRGEPKLSGPLVTVLIKLMFVPLLIATIRISLIDRGDHKALPLISKLQE